MDSSKSFDEKIKIDNNLSNRYIDLDPNGYFIIKVDLEKTYGVDIGVVKKKCLIYILNYATTSQLNGQ